VVVAQGPVRCDGEVVDSQVTDVVSEADIGEGDLSRTIDAEHEGVHQRERLVLAVVVLRGASHVGSLAAWYHESRVTAPVHAPASMTSSISDTAAGPGVVFIGLRPSHLVGHRTSTPAGWEEGIVP
jgi:hypothetical protein